MLVTSTTIRNTAGCHFSIELIQAFHLYNVLTLFFRVMRVLKPHLNEMGYANGINPRFWKTTLLKSQSLASPP
jgi:hypothetical protein